MKAFFAWIGRMLSEPTGEPSFSRTISFIAFLVTLSLDVAQYVRTGQPPASTSMLAESAGAVAPYMINQLRAAVKPLSPSPAAAVAAIPALVTGVKAAMVGH